MDAIPLLPKAEAEKILAAVKMVEEKKREKEKEDNIHKINKGQRLVILIY